MFRATMDALNDDLASSVAGARPRGDAAGGSGPADLTTSRRHIDLDPSIKVSGISCAPHGGVRN